MLENVGSSRSRNWPSVNRTGERFGRCHLVDADALAASAGGAALTSLGVVERKAEDIDNLGFAN